MIFWLALVSAFSQNCHADPFTANVYAPDSSQKALLYTLVSTESHDGGHLKMTGVFSTPDGKVAATEISESDGDRLVKYTLDLGGANQHGSIEARNGKLFFSFTSDGKTKTDDDSYPERAFVPPTTISLIVANWDKIAKGDTVDGRFASTERRETVGFKFFKSDETDSTMTVTMKPSSFIIAAIVKPVFFIFDKKTHRALEYKGRILPKRNDNGSWKDVDADLVYKYTN